MAEKFDPLAAMAMAKQMLEDTGEVPPLLFVSTRNDQQNIIISLAGGGADWSTFDSRAALVATVGGMVASKGMEPVDVALLTDVWVAKLAKGEEYNPDMPPSKSPNRQEAIVVSSLSSEGATGYAQRTYERTEAGIVWTEGEPEWKAFAADDSENKVEAFLLENFWRGYRTQLDPMSAALDALDAKEEPGRSHLADLGGHLHAVAPITISPDEREALRRMVASRFTTEQENNVDQDPTD